MTQSTVIPCLRYRDAPAAIQWLGEVLGFEPQLVVPGPGKTIAHAQLRPGRRHADGGVGGGYRIRQVHSATRRAGRGADFRDLRRRGRRRRRIRAGSSARVAGADSDQGRRVRRAGIYVRRSRGACVERGDVRSVGRLNFTTTARRARRSERRTADCVISRIGSRGRSPRLFMSSSCPSCRRGESFPSRNHYIRQCRVRRNSLPRRRFRARPYHNRAASRKIGELLGHRALGGTTHLVRGLAVGRGARLRRPSVPSHLVLSKEPSRVASLFVIQGRDQGIAIPSGRVGPLDRPHPRPFHSAARHRGVAQSRRARPPRRHLRRSATWAAPTARSSTAGWSTERELISGDQVQVGRSTLLYTGFNEERLEDLAGKVDIVPRAGDRRRLADRRLAQPDRRQRMADARRPRLVAPLAQPGPQQPADHVSHGAGGEPHDGHRPAAGPHHGDDLRLGRRRPRLHHAQGSRDGQADAQGAPPPPRPAQRREDLDQQDDSRLRRRAERRRAHQQRPRRLALGPGPEHRQPRRPRGDLRADAGALRGGRRHLHRHGRHAAEDARRQGRQPVHRGAPAADDRHRPPGGAGGRGHVLLQGAGAGGTPGGHRPDDRLAVASHQEHPARRPRRQLPHRAGPRRSRRRRRERRRAPIPRQPPRRPSTRSAKAGRIVERNQERISSLVLDMLTFSKEREPDPRPSDLNQVAAEVST